jgi:hypothetical protein
VSERKGGEERYGTSPGKARKTHKHITTPQKGRKEKEEEEVEEEEEAQRHTHTSPSPLP